MEKRVFLELGAIFILAISSFIFLYNSNGITGNVVSENPNECNILDFNGDGKVDYVDKVLFNRILESESRKDYYCGYSDLNNDNKINILDSNKFAELFQKNYGEHKSPCELRKLSCKGGESETTSSGTSSNSVSNNENQETTAPQTDNTLISPSDVASNLKEKETKEIETPVKSRIRVWIFIIIGIIIVVCVVFMYVYFFKKRNTNKKYKG